MNKLIAVMAILSLGGCAQTTVQQYQSTGMSSGKAEAQVASERNERLAFAGVLALLLVIVGTGGFKGDIGGGQTPPPPPPP